MSVFPIFVLVEPAEENMKINCNAKLLAFRTVSGSVYRQWSACTAEIERHRPGFPSVTNTGILTLKHDGVDCRLEDMSDHFFLCNTCCITVRLHGPCGEKLVKIKYVMKNNFQFCAFINLSIKYANWHVWDYGILEKLLTVFPTIYRTL